jgi:hypothetical protein
MAPDPTPSRPEPATPIRVNLNDDVKRAYWVASLGVTEERLREIVSEIGPVARDVRYYLGRP